MPRVIVLDTFPLSCAGKRIPSPGASLTLSEECHQWLRACVTAGNQIIAPAICYYEVMREMERLGANSQINRIRQFCFTTSGRFLSITDGHLESAAKLWALARNQGTPTASAEALDGDVILAAQMQSLGLLKAQAVLATTNVGHLSLFVNAQLWTEISPGS
ncbi:hypothetical protein EON83_07575 [bacterium]|nr:MAG: hypothetical protein EON83_07575 [bacterium]